MTVIRGMFASARADAVFMRRLNGWLTLFWVAMIPISYQLGWLKSVTYVSALSLWALVSGHWSTWQAARVEVMQDEQIQAEANNPVEDRVLEKLVDETEIGKSAASRTNPLRQ